jgi:hypothetical protein
MDMSDIYTIESNIDTIIDEEIQKARSNIKERVQQLLHNISKDIPRISLKNIDDDLSVSINVINKNNTDNINNTDNNNIQDSYKDIYTNDLIENGTDLTNSELPTYTININGETYFVTDNTPSFIFERDPDDPESIGEHVGLYYDDVAYLINTYKGKKVYISMLNGGYYEYISDMEIGDRIE